MKKPMWKMFMRLRADALARDMTDLAITYGNAAIRLGFEVLEDMARNAR